MSPVTNAMATLINGCSSIFLSALRNWSNKEFLAIACRRLGELFAITEADRKKALDMVSVDVTGT
jgi:hypothetical protein